MKNEKLVGYILLGIGLLVIILAGVNVYMVFNKQAMPVQLFSFPPVSVDLSPTGGGGLPPGLTLPKTELLSSEMLNQTSNIAAHFFLMGFVVSIGYRIASLGVSLVRTIEVKVRGTEVKG